MPVRTHGLCRRGTAGKDGLPPGYPFSGWNGSLDKFWEKDEATAVLEKTKGKDAKVKDVTKSKFKQSPPTPFDLTSLQLEAHKTLGLTPKRTLEVAQILYLPAQKCKAHHKEGMPSEHPAAFLKIYFDLSQQMVVRL